MKINGKVDAEALMESRRMLWAPHYKANLFNNYMWHRLGFIRLMLIVFAIALLTSVLAVDPRLIGWPEGLIASGVLGMAIWRSQTPNKRLIDKLNENVGSYVVASEGVMILPKAGQVISVPWTALKRWYRGESVVVLASGGDSQLLLLPIRSLQPEELDALVQICNENLGLQNAHSARRSF